jgi:outer membrane protein OmpA-like peptidoglycan-associated protein
MRYQLLAVILTALVPGMAQAADQCAGALTAEQIRNCLANPSTPRMLSRGIKPARGITVEGEQPQAREASVNLVVNFEFDSADLTNDGMISLDALGNALSDSALRDDRFRIAGHTDAVGSDSYNQRLSEDRAASVRSYLAQHYNLDPNKFEVVGYGKSQLYDPNDPTSAINRRVQIIKLGN